jgi:hypothetical protein
MLMGTAFAAAPRLHSEAPISSPRTLPAQSQAARFRHESVVDLQLAERDRASDFLKSPEVKLAGERIRRLTLQEVKW